MLKEALRIVDKMHRDGLISKYAIGGAVGALFYLEPFDTLDVDIFVVLPTVVGGQVLSLSAIDEYLLSNGYSTRAEYIVIEDWAVQFLPATTKLELEALNAALTIQAEDVPTWVMTAEHLIAICLKTGRAKDYARIVQFLEQTEDLDMPKLQEILARHGLTQKWELFTARFLHE